MNSRSDNSTVYDRIITFDIDNHNLVNTFLKMDTAIETKKTLLFFIPSFGDGGVEKMLVNLANGLVQRDISIVFMTKKSARALPYLPELSEQVCIKAIDGQQLQQQLMNYLDNHAVDVLISAKFQDDQIVKAVKQSRADNNTRYYVSVGTSLQTRTRRRYKNIIRRFLYRRKVKKTYKDFDGYLANSKPVGDELSAFCDLPKDKIHILHHPTITPDIQQLSKEKIEHFENYTVPVIIGIGRLGKAKGFDVLMEAFALLRKKRSCKLLILGKGGKQEALKKLAQTLNITDDVMLPGFVENPYAYLRRSSLFVLSSRWEGCPNALVEALSLGIPVVATECAGSVNEILQQGLYGEVVPVDDPVVLAKTIESTLDSPPHPVKFLQQAALPYTQEQSCDAYVEALKLG